MGPPSFEGGNLGVTDRYGVGMALLQWGRLLSKAETVNAKTSLVTEVTLQWGRLLSKAETSLLENRLCHH